MKLLSALRTMTRCNCIDARSTECSRDAAASRLIASDDTTHLVEQAPLDANATSGTVTIVPSPAHVFVFLEDRLLLSVPAADCAGVEGLQLGAGGGTVYIDSVRVKDRTR